jgi:hypothetical protein
LLARDENAPIEAQMTHDCMVPIRGIERSSKDLQGVFLHSLRSLTVAAL